MWDYYSPAAQTPTSTSHNYRPTSLQEKRDERKMKNFALKIKN